MKNILIAVLAVIAGYFFWVLWVTGPDRTAMYERELETRQILVEVAPLRPVIWEHYLYHGEFPQRWEDLSLDPEAMRSSRVKQVSLGAGGALIVQPANTDTGRLWITPTLTMDGLSMEWSCETNLSAFAGRDCKLSRRSDFAE